MSRHMWWSERVGGRGGGARRNVTVTDLLVGGRWVRGKISRKSLVRERERESGKTAKTGNSDTSLDQSS